MRRFAQLPLLLAALATSLPAAAIEPVVEAGEEIETRADGDLNGDGEPDLAYVVGTGEWRELRVVLSYKSEVEIGVEPPAVPGASARSRNHA